MIIEDNLTALINRIRSGDQAAIAELLASNKAEAKAAIRWRLSTGNRVRRLVDSSDLLLSILFRLYEEESQSTVENGAYYLKRIAGNHVVDHGRRLRTKKRDVHRESPWGVNLHDAADPSPPPLEMVIQKERLEAFLKALSPSELVITERRIAGEGWEAIADGTGVKADTVRKQFSRTLKMLQSSFLET